MPGVNHLPLVLLCLRAIDAVAGVPLPSKMIRNLAERSDASMLLSHVDASTAKRAAERATSGNPKSGSHVVVIVILVVVIVGAVPLLFFCGRMFYRIWKSPTAGFYSSTAVDDEEMVKVDGDGPSSFNGAEGRPLLQTADARASAYSHSSQPSLSSTEEEHRGLLRLSDFSKPPSPPPTQLNDSPTKTPPINRKPPPSLMNANSSPSGAQTPSKLSVSVPPDTDMPVAMRAEQLPMPPTIPPIQTSPPATSSPKGFVAPGPPPPLQSSITTPPRQTRNPYRGESSQRDSQRYPSSVPEPIHPPPQVPPILKSPPASPPSAEEVPRSPPNGSRPMGPRRPGGARPRSEVPSMLSTMSVTSEATAPGDTAGIRPLQYQRGPLPLRVRA